MENNFDLTGGGLVCDNPKCDWEDMTIKIEDYPQHINEACPTCGDNLLTEEEYKGVMDLFKAVDMVNTMTPEQMESMISNLTPEQMDQALDKMSELGFEKEVDEDGNDNWCIKHDKHK